MKKKSPTWYRKECVKKAKIKAKERDGYRCNYCGKVATGIQMHGSHILPEGSYPLMSADPYNIIALCAEHHVGGSNSYMNKALESWHSHPAKFGLWFNEKFPGRLKELYAMNEEKKKHLINWEKEYQSLTIK